MLYQKLKIPSSEMYSKIREMRLFLFILFTGTIIIIITWNCILKTNINLTTENYDLISSSEISIKTNKKLPSNKLYKFVENKTQVKRKLKYILFWTKFYNYTNWKMNLTHDSDIYYGPEFFEELGCPETDCVLTSNRSVLPNIYEYDVIIFHAVEKRQLDTPVPEFRSAHQIYVMAAQEPPTSVHHPFDLEDDFYNWTLTYKLNSDVIWPYSRVRDKIYDEIIAPSKYPRWRPVEEDFYDDDIFKVVENKTKMAAQFLSHCNALSNRDKLTKTLQKYITVEVYGKCGNGNFQCKRFEEPCDDLLDTDYKFYLSFENEICEDYVTEKLFNALKRMVIPVVFGGADYNRWAPPYSYINVNDFNTVKDLADYLIYLDKNPKEYIKYFWWKRYYKAEDRKFHAIGYCNICTKLINSLGTEYSAQYYVDIKNWFSSTCHRNRTIKFE